MEIFPVNKDNNNNKYLTANIDYFLIAVVLNLSIRRLILQLIKYFELLIALYSM